MTADHIPVKQPPVDAIHKNRAKQRLEHPRTREADIEAYLKRKAETLGGEVRKVQWGGRRGAPDRVLMMPYAWQIERNHRHNTVWVELKAPGIAPEPHQLREHARMRAVGQRVEVIDSFEGVDELLGT